MVKLSLALLAVLPAVAAAGNLRGGRDLGDMDAQAMGAALDARIANFALQLECLEAEFYSYAAYGRGLSKELRGGGPPSIGGKKAKLSKGAQMFAEAMARDEANHLQYLRDTLGKGAVPCPQMDIGPAFAAAADAAVGSKLKPRYSPYYNDLWFLLGAFILEDVGVTAYRGAIPRIDNGAIQYAATGMLATEAYHGGAVRAVLAGNASTKLKPYTFTVAEATTAISKLRAKVGGGKDKPLFNKKGRLLVAPGNDKALAFGRAIREVKAIVYLGDADKPGGFFPKGMHNV